MFTLKKDLTRANHCNTYTITNNGTVSFTIENILVNPNETIQMVYETHTDNYKLIGCNVINNLKDIDFTT